MKLGGWRQLMGTDRLAVLAAGAVALIVAGVACGSGATSTTTTSKPLADAGSATFTEIPYQGAADCWNPGTCNQGKMFLNVYGTLLYINPDGKLTGYMAESWTASPTTITFTLKKGITCSDGTPVTPSVVAGSLQYYFTGPSPSKLANFGPGPYSVVADDAASKVTVTLGTPFADAIYAFDDQYPGHQTSIICPAGISALKANPQALATGDKTYGTGPYVVSQSIPGGNVTLKLRPEFNWGPNGVTAKTAGIPGTIVYQIVNNMTTAANLVESGSVNMASISGPDASRLASNSKLAHMQLKSNQVNPMYINQSPGRVGADIKVRQAMITAVDPKLYLQALGSPGTLSPTFITPNVPCYDAAAVSKLVPKPSVSAATKILQDDGYTMSNGVLAKNGQPLTFDFPARAGFGSAAEYLANTWTQMGAVVKLQQVDAGTWSSRLVGNNYDVTVLNNVLYPPTAAQAASLFGTPLPPTGRNYMRMQDAQQIVSLVNQAEAASGSAVCPIISKIEQSVWENWDFLPVYAPISDWYGSGVDNSKWSNPNNSVFGIRMLKV